MPSESDVREAVRACQKQRFAGLVLLRVDKTKASPAEISLCGKIKGSKDADALDKFLTQKAVVELFARGVFFFGGGGGA